MSANPAAPRVLLVDDDESIRFPVGDYLGLHGYVVDCASDVVEALERLARSTYAGAIVDLHLSSSAEPEGLALVERLAREHPRTRVVVLAACEAGLAAEALRRGADWVLQKPSPLSRVAEVVDVLCRSPRPFDREGP